MLILLQIDVVAKIFDPNPWNFYTKNWSSLKKMFKEGFWSFWNISLEGQLTQNACDIDFVLSPHLMTAAITELWCIAKMLESTRGKDMMAWPLEKYKEKIWLREIHHHDQDN